MNRFSFIFSVDNRLFIYVLTLVSDAADNRAQNLNRCTKQHERWKFPKSPLRKAVGCKPKLYRHLIDKKRIITSSTEPASTVPATGWKSGVWGLAVCWMADIWRRTKTKNITKPPNQAMRLGFDLYQPYFRLFRENILCYQTSNRINKPNGIAPLNEPYFPQSRN